MKTGKRLALLMLCLVLVAGIILPGCASPCSGGPALRVLFIGNSYLFTNNLPALFEKLACSGGHKVITAMAASGGWTLADHFQSKDTIKLIQSQPWDVVVLQEQSEIPSIEYDRVNWMYPAVRSLVNVISDHGSEPVLFLTWAHRDGLTDSGMKDYAQMQSQLNAGYEGIAGQLHIRVVPAGKAWQAALKDNPPDLWNADGSHPSRAGSYLAACTLYAELFQQDPVGLTYRDGLSQPDAEILQKAVESLYSFSK